MHTVIPNRENLFGFRWENKENGTIEKFEIINKIFNKWIIMGDLLDIPWQDIGTWRHKKNDKECCAAVLNHWLTNQHPEYTATWEGLCVLLDDCELSQVALSLKVAINTALR